MLNRTVLVFLLTACALIGGVSGAEEPDDPGHPSNTPFVTRVFYLEGIDLREAMTLARQTIHVRSVAIVNSRSVMVVSDAAEPVSQVEALLKQRNVVLRAAEPHAPLYLERLQKDPTGTRIFRVERDSMENVVTLLRAIYMVREVKKSEEDSAISASAALPILDAAEALFRELRLLDESAAMSTQLTESVPLGKT